MADLTVLDLNAGPPPLFVPTAKPTVYRRRTLPPQPRNNTGASSSTTDLPAIVTRKVKRRRRSSLGSIGERIKADAVTGNTSTALPDSNHDNRAPAQNPSFLSVPSRLPPPRPRSAPPIPIRFLHSYLPHPVTRAPVKEVVKPAPPLLRPTTFWRRTLRSGVTSPSYSPSSHLIRRSTFIAAGLAFDRPYHDLSAFCVESRVGFVVLAPDFELLKLQ